jgi:hypothetical protein
MSNNNFTDIGKTFGELLLITRKSFENSVKLFDTVQAQAQKNIDSVQTQAQRNLDSAHEQAQKNYDFATRAAQELQEANKALATEWIGQLEQARQGYAEAFKSGLGLWGQQTTQ